MDIMATISNCSSHATVEQMNISFSNSSLEKLSPESSCHSVLLYDFHSFLIPTIYGTIFVVGFIGNTIVIVVRCLKVSRKTVANTYILNLAIADLLFLLSLPLWAVYYAQNYNWTFGTFLCKICGAVLSVNLYASIFFIACMSVDRYLAIVHPLQSQSRRSLCQAQFITMMVWSLAFFSTLPTIYFRNTYYLEEYKVTACIMDFPQNDFSTWSAALGLMKNTLGFLVPFSIIISCYIGIGKYLLKTPYLEINKHKRDKVLWMVLAVVLAFFICWFPFHILTFLDVLTTLNFITSCKLKALIDTLMPFTLCVAFANSSINPLLYCFVGNDFQQELSYLVKRLMSFRKNTFLTAVFCYMEKVVFFSKQLMCINATLA
uniref:Type-1 angiotensin II receptor n=1 Tax=Erpetoichthys calabaricus TaxID=27687 RepID=A0A8C4SF69_ERPCA